MRIHTIQGPTGSGKSTFLDAQAVKAKNRGLTVIGPAPYHQAVHNLVRAVANSHHRVLVLLEGGEDVRQPTQNDVRKIPGIDGLHDKIAAVYLTRLGDKNDWVTL